MMYYNMTMLIVLFEKTRLCIKAHFEYQLKALIVGLIYWHERSAKYAMVFFLLMVWFDMISVSQLTLL